MILINAVADWMMLTGTQLPTFEIWLLNILLMNPQKLKCVLEVLEDANEVVDGIFKPGEKAFSVSKSCCR